MPLDPDQMYRAMMAAVRNANDERQQLATQLKVAGIEVFSAGDFEGDEATEDLVLHDAQRGVYKRLVLKDNRVRGAVLYGDARDGAWYFELISEGSDVSRFRNRLLFGREFALRN